MGVGRRGSEVVEEVVNRVERVAGKEGMGYTSGGERSQ